MTCELGIDLKVERFAALADVAFLDRRPELVRLCRAGREAGGVLGPAAVQAALPGVSDAGASNVVAWCRLLRLCDDRGCLTRIGEDVADGNPAPVPEQGLFEFWAVSHPLTGNRIVHLRRLDSRSDNRLEEIRPLPFLPVRDRVFGSVVRTEQQVVLRALLSNHSQDGVGAGCIPRQTAAQCGIRWTLDSTDNSNEWKLEGRLDSGRERSFEIVQHEPERHEIDVRSLFDQWATRHLAAHGRWNAGEPRLAIPFSGVTEAGRESFSQDYPIPQAEVPGVGVFTKVELKSVPVGPASTRDATDWAMARLDARLHSDVRCRTRSEVRALFLSVVEDTPLEAQGPELPDHETLLRAQREAPDVFWSLAAPVDLAPRPIEPALLDALKLSGSQPQFAGASGADVIRVPYRGGWSMSRLVEGLLGETTPRRVVLCDRYVRGKANLDALGLLVSAIRRIGPESGVEVITEADAGPADNLKAIRSITGAAPRRYEQVFGGTRKDQPHARYLLVEGRNGERFAWQMDNSPLDCRADPGAPPEPDAPLRWRDFMAVRVRPDELPLELARILTGGTR